jgi:hypothetical protein
VTGAEFTILLTKTRYEYARNDAPDTFDHGRNGPDVGRVKPYA